jgi:hypothetical protein
MKDRHFTQPRFSPVNASNPAKGMRASFKVDGVSIRCQVPIDFAGAPDAQGWFDTVYVPRENALGVPDAFAAHLDTWERGNNQSVSSDTLNHYAALLRLHVAETALGSIPIPNITTSDLVRLIEALPNAPARHWRARGGTLSRTLSKGSIKCIIHALKVFICGNDKIVGLKTITEGSLDCRSIHSALHDRAFITACKLVRSYIKSTSTDLRTSEGCDEWLDSLNIPNILGVTREVLIRADDRNHRVDGFNPATGEIYLYHGDYVHGGIGSDRMAGCKSMDETYAYQHRLMNAGFIVHVMWASNWKTRRKALAA